MGRKVVQYSWGGFIGLVIGMILAKSYQAWAILYRMNAEWVGIHNVYENGANHTLWFMATEKPLDFMLLVSMIFSLLGLAFVKTVIRK